MDPITLAMLASTAISAGGALMGAGESSKTNKDNQRIAMMNAQARERERAQAMAMAQQLQQQTQLGMTDAGGSRIYFDPERGWVSTLGATDQAIQGRNIAAGGTADALLREFNGFQPTSGERMSGLLYDKATRGLNDAFQGQLATGLRTATRQSNPRLAAALIGQSSKAQGEAQHNAAVDSEIRGRQYADQYNTSQRGALQNLFGAFAGQGAQQAGLSRYIPQFANEASGAGRAGLQAAMSQGGTLAERTPDNGYANALASIGQLGYGTAQQYGANQRLDQAMQTMREKYLGKTG